MLESTAFTGNWLSRRKLIVAGVILLALSGLLLLVASKWPFSQQRIAQSLQQTFPLTVTFQKFRPVYFPHPGCIAEGVEFRRLGGNASLSPIVAIERLTIEGHYLDMIFRPGQLSRIATRGFVVKIPPRGTKFAETEWRATPSDTRVGEVVLDGAVVEIARDEPHSPLRFDIRKLRLRSVSEQTAMRYDVALHNPLPPGEITAHGEFGPWNSEDFGQTPITGNYSFRNADLSTFAGIAGTLSSDDMFKGQLERIETRGTIDIPDFEVTRSKHSVHLRSSFHAFVNAKNGDVNLERVVATFLQTRIVAKGEIAGKSGTHGKTATVDLSASNGRIQDVLRLFVREAKPPLNGITDFRARAIVPAGKEEFLRRILLSGDFGVTDGQFTRISTQESVGEFSERASGAKPQDEDPADKDRAIAHLSGHVELRQAVATCSNISFGVPGATAQMHGTYGLESRKIDLHGLLKSDAELSQMTSGFKSALLKPFDVFFKKKRAGAVVPVHLIGTYDDPQPGIDIIPKKTPDGSSTGLP